MRHSGALGPGSLAPLTIRDEYYYGVFWGGTSDLNNDNPAAREEGKKIARFWLEEMGVDGFRLDAIAYLVEDGGRLERSPGTHAFLRDFAAGHPSSAITTRLARSRRLEESGRAKGAATLLLTLPSHPFVYYGEVIGMTGDKN